MTELEMKMFFISTSLKMFLHEMGLDKVHEKGVSDEPDTRHYYLVKGYYNDPRNDNGEVSF